MKRLTENQRRNIREILEDKSCAYCKHLFSLVDWWCGNEDAIKARGTSSPGVIHCPYFKMDKNYTRKIKNNIVEFIKRLKINRYENQRITKLFKKIIY